MDKRRKYRPPVPRRQWKAPQLIVIESTATHGRGTGTANTGTEAGPMFTAKLTGSTERSVLSSGTAMNPVFSFGPGNAAS